MEIPKTTISEIIGLLETVHDAGDIEDAALLADDFDLELDEILPSIDGAELLGFASVNDGNIELTEDAKKLLESNIRERKKLIREKVANIGIIKELINKLLESENHKISKDEVIEFLKKRISSDDIESSFNTIINWTRHAGLMVYDSEYEELCLKSK